MTFLFKNQNRMFIYGDIPNLIKIAGECGFIAIRGKNYDIHILMIFVYAG